MRLTLACVARQATLAIKTSRGYEREVADTLLARAEEKPDVVFSLLVPSSLRGYVFAEGMSSEGVREMLKGIRKARGLVEGETTLKEVEPLLVPKITVEGFVEGAIVELISGPFKGEKARVKKIDQAKEEIDGRADRGGRPDSGDGPRRSRSHVGARRREEWQLK